MAGDKVGVACTICHTITDESVYSIPGGVSIGRRIDRPANLNPDMGALLALATHSRGYYPNPQVTLSGKTIARAPKGLTPDSTETEVDAHLKNREYYPVGTFDETSTGRDYQWNVHREWHAGLNRSAYRSFLREGQFTERIALAIRIESRTNRLVFFEKMFGAMSLRGFHESEQEP